MGYEPMASEEFEARYIGLSGKLSELLDIVIMDAGEDSIEKYLHGSFSEIMHHHNKENYKSRDVGIQKLAFLAKHLENIKEYNKGLFEDFKSEFNTVTYNEYFGSRFEAAICSSFIDKSLDFRKRERPDFEISRSYDIFFECTSSHLPQEKDHGLEYKLERAIECKAKKSYASKNTALMVEATNLSHHMAATEASLKDKQELKQHLKSEVRKSDYGSVLIFTFLFKDKNFQSAYIRIDNEDTDAELEEFLNEHYPEGDMHVDKPFFPREG